MGQLSFYSAEARGPRVADLAGVLCGPGQVVGFGRTAARLSVPLAESWRAKALAREYALRGVAADVVGAEDGYDVRTAFRADLLFLTEWNAATGKAVPDELALDGAVLRLWALACGQPDERGYVLALDAAAPGTHEPLTGALAAAGLPSQRVGSRSGEPAVRLIGRRRLARLEELVGSPPPGAEPAWPVSAPVRRAG